MLHLETVSEDLQRLIQAICQRPELQEFRLVGGTALRLFLGHRISVDADFFTDRSCHWHHLRKGFFIKIFKHGVLTLL